MMASSPEANTGFYTISLSQGVPRRTRERSAGRSRLRLQRSHACSLPDNSCSAVNQSTSDEPSGRSYLLTQSLLLNAIGA